MPWVCPKNCHLEDPENFQVEQDEYRTDTITHRYAQDDKELENDLGDPKVFVGDDATWEIAQCSICQSEVSWEEPDE